MNKWLLPGWAQSVRPILQYELAQRRLDASRKTVAWQLLLLALLFCGGGYLYASVAALDLSAGKLADGLWRCLYFPTLLLQTATVLAALALGIGSVFADRSRQTWDSLRATELGVGMTLRARWLGILFRLRAPIIALLLARLLCACGMIVNMTAFGGGYLRIITGGLMDGGAGDLLTLCALALQMTTLFLLPLATIGGASALGILIAVAIRQRPFASTIQLVLSAAHVAALIAGLLAVTSLLQGRLIMSDGLLFALVTAFCGFLDGGMLLANFDTLGALWQLQPQGALMSIGLLCMLALLACWLDGCLGLAIRLSERGE